MTRPPQISWVLLGTTGFVTPAQLAAHHEYALVGAFVVGAVFTPSNVVSQLLAIPLYLLYEGGLVAAWALAPGVREVEEQQKGS